jgi:dTDP-glucose 4,6-dehydratase
MQGNEVSRHTPLVAKQGSTPRLPAQDLDHVLSRTDGLWDDLRDASIFITGGTGFVGTWLLESLLWADDRLNLGVRVVALTRDPVHFRARSPHLVGHPAIRLQAGDITTFDFPEGTFHFVIHAASGGSFLPDAGRPLAVFPADVDGTMRVLEFARTHGVRRFLFTSSGAVYGKQPPEMTCLPEEYAGAPPPADPASGYGQAKRVSEFMSMMYGRVFGFDALIARLFAFVGPLLPLHLNYAIGNFIRDALRGGPVRIQGDGTPYRSYLYAADLAIWLWTILLRGKPAHPCNVGSEHDLTIAQLARTVVDVVAPGTQIEIAGHPVLGAPPRRYVPSTIRAQEELGLQSWISLEEGIRRMSAWYQHRRQAVGTCLPASKLFS